MIQFLNDTRRKIARTYLAVCLRFRRREARSRDFGYLQKGIALLLLVATLAPQVALAVFNTQSALLVAASSQYFSRADTASLSITGSITVECWIKPTSFASLPAVVASKVNGSINSGGWLMNVEDDGAGNSQIGLQISDGSGNATGRGSTDLDAFVGSWVHVAGTWTAGAGNFPLVYVNGVADNVTGGTGQTAITDTNTDTYLGAQNNAGTPIRFFDGRESLCRVWNVARTAAEILASYCTQLGATTNLQAEWTLDNTLNDNSGNANTLTNNNSATFAADVPAVCATTPFAPWQMFPF